MWLETVLHITVLSVDQAWQDRGRIFGVLIGLALFSAWSVWLYQM